MSTQTVLICDSYLPFHKHEAASSPHTGDKKFVIYYERFVNGWGILNTEFMDPNVDDNRVLDLCPMCMVYNLCMWVQWLSGGERFGRAIVFQNSFDEKELEWIQNYVPSMEDSRWTISWEKGPAMEGGVILPEFMRNY